MAKPIIEALRSYLRTTEPVVNVEPDNSIEARIAFAKERTEHPGERGTEKGTGAQESGAGRTEIGSSIKVEIDL